MSPVGPTGDTGLNPRLKLAIEQELTIRSRMDLAPQVPTLSARFEALAGSMFESSQTH